jgi:hypothetical protein
MSSGFNTPIIGKAGVPGSSDLSKALNRLASRRRAETQRAQERRSRSKLYKDSLIFDEQEKRNGSHFVIKIFFYHFFDKFSLEIN